MSRLQSHYEKAAHFLPLSSQKFLVLIWSTSERWRAESSLEPPSTFEPGTPGLGIHCPNHWDNAPYLARCLKPRWWLWVKCGKPRSWLKECCWLKCAYLVKYLRNSVTVKISRICFKFLTFWCAAIIINMEESSGISHDFPWKLQKLD